MLNFLVHQDKQCQKAHWKGGHKIDCQTFAYQKRILYGREYPVDPKFHWGHERIRKAIKKFWAIYVVDLGRTAAALYGLHSHVHEDGTVDLQGWKSASRNHVVMVELQFHDGEVEHHYEQFVLRSMTLQAIDEEDLVNAAFRDEPDDELYIVVGFRLLQRGGEGTAPERLSPGIFIRAMLSKELLIAK